MFENSAQGDTNLGTCTPLQCLQPKIPAKRYKETKKIKAQGNNSSHVSKETSWKTSWLNQRRQ